MKKLSVIIFYVLFAASLWSQTPSWQWVNKICTFYTPNNAIATDQAGNVYVAGRYYNGPVIIGGYTLAEGWASSENLFMVKYDPYGTILWAKRVTSAKGLLNVTELVCDNAGNVYIAGRYTESLLQMGSVTFSSSGTSAYHSYFAKFDPAGNLIWSKTLDDSENEIRDIDVDASGNLIVIGDYWETALSVQTTTLNNTGYRNMFIIKYDTNGNLLWAKRENSGQFGFAGEVAFDKTGNFCMRYSSDGDFINKYDAQGNVLWLKKITDTQNLMNRHLVCDAQLNIYYTGDDTLHKLNLSGSPIYKKKLGQGNAESFTDKTLFKDMSADDQGNIYLCGSFSYESMSVETHTLFNSYLYNNYGPKYGKQLFLLKLNPSGNVVWLKGASGSFHHEAIALTIDKNGNTFITGTTSGASLNFDGKILSSATQNNSFIARLGSGSSTPVGENNPEVSFLIYPNPASGFLNLEFPAGMNKDFTVTISNALSQLIYKKQCPPEDQHVVLQLDKISKGIYFVELRSGTNSTTKKILVD